MEERPTRVAYREGQRLSADDLTAEQEYLVALERRHNLTQHSAGVVSGLARGEGVAVDAEGRLLIVGEKAAIDDKACLDVWLIHCERCGRDRSRELARIVTVPVTPGAPRSAPTSSAVYLGRFGCKDDPYDPEYTSVAASAVRDPARRALMQVGPATVNDRNAFVISTAAANGALAPRIIIDTFGNNRFIGSVMLADYHYCHLLPLTSDLAVVLRSEAPGASGPALHLLITPSGLAGERILTVQTYSGTVKSGEALVWHEASLRADIEKLSGSADLAIRFKPASLLRQRLFLDTAPQRVRSEQATVQPRALFDRFTVQQDVQLHPCGGSLRIDDWPARELQSSDVRGCQDDLPPLDSVPLRDRSGLSFKPMPKTPQAPPIPGIYSVRTGDAADPGEDLRIDLGEKKDSDLTVRFAAGAHASEKDDFDPWLQINGIGGLTLPDGPYPSDKPIPVSVHVNGTIERGPIKPDLSDPNFTNLMAMAWLAGLQKVIPESTQFELEFVLPTTLIDTTDQLAYDIDVNNKSLLSAATAEGFIETLTVPNGNPHILSAPIKPVASLTKNQKTFATKVIHQPAELPAGTIGIYVIVYGKTAGTWWWKSGKTEVTIVAAPVLDISGIPKSAPADTPFDAVVAILNADDQRSFTVQTVSIGGEVNARTDIECKPHKVVTFTRTYAAGIHTGRDIDISAALKWDTGTLTALNGTAKVQVRDDLKVDVAITTLPSTTTALKYDLKLTNMADAVVKLTSLRQQLTSAGFSPTPATPKKITPADATLDPAQESTTSVTGAKMPAAAQHVTLELTVEYKRDGFTWKLPVIKKEIAIP